MREEPGDADRRGDHEGRRCRKRTPHRQPGATAAGGATAGAAAAPRSSPPQTPPSGRPRSCGSDSIAREVDAAGPAPYDARPMIETDNLRREYGGRVALHGLTLRVAAGEILGFLGPNGAGKSTTVKILTGMIKPDSGRARVAGYRRRQGPARGQAAHRLRAGVGGALRVADRARVPRTDRLALSPAAQAAHAARVEEMLARFDLSHAIDQRLSEFSKGMKQKVLIASALMHRPEVLFLDEPLTGLDANAALVVKELMRGLAAQGRTIFFCSHVLEVVERVCTRIVIIDQGRVIADGTRGRDCRGRRRLDARAGVRDADRDAGRGAGDARPAGGARTVDRLLTALGIDAGAVARARAHLRAHGLPRRRRRGETARPRPLRRVAAGRPDGGQRDRRRRVRVDCRGHRPTCCYRRRCSPPTAPPTR